MNVNIYHKHKDIIITTFIIASRAYLQHQIDIPQFLNWSEQPIVWSREDHSPRIEYPGRVALVVKPKVGDYWLPKTLMEGRQLHQHPLPRHLQADAAPAVDDRDNPHYVPRHRPRSEGVPDRQSHAASHVRHSGKLPH